MGLGLKISAGLLLVILAMGGVGYWYYTDSQATIATLQENNAKLEVSLKQEKETLKALQADIKAAEEEIDNVNKEFAQVRRQNNELAERLEKHNLGFLAANKPGLVERVVNRATEKAGRCFELISGAELTEAEKNAESGQAFNSECPWLYDEYKEANNEDN